MEVDLIAIGIIIGAILFSITVHEAVHAYTSYWLGDDTAMRLGRLTLNPLAHIDLFTTILLPVLLYASGLPPFGAAKPVPFNPARVKWDEYGAALVGVAGPLSNLLIAAFLGLWIRFTVGLNTGFASEVLELVIIVNIALFVFNMIPWPPLDGSRLLYAFAPDGLRRVMSQIESFGLMGIALFIFLIFPLFQPIISEAVTVLFRLFTGAG